MVTSLSLYNYICIYNYVYLSLYLYIYVCMCIYIYMYMYVCIYIYIYIYMHLCICARTCMCLRTQPTCIYMAADPHSTYSVENIRKVNLQRRKCSKTVYTVSVRKFNLQKWLQALGYFKHPKGTSGLIYIYIYIMLY